MKRVLFITMLLVLPIGLAIAADPVITYHLAAPLPGGQDTVSGFIDYAKYLFPFLLSVAVFSALVVFVYGGIEYMASGGNPSRASAGKEKITDAILGLLLAVGSILVLRTINPKLVELNLDIPAVGTRAVNEPLDPAACIPGQCGGPCFGACQDPVNQVCIAEGGGSHSCQQKTHEDPCPNGQPPLFNSCPPQFSCNQGEICVTCNVIGPHCYYP